VQCHNLPNPAMHQAAKWPEIFERMWSHEGQGNLAADAGHDGGVEAPRRGRSGNSTRLSAQAQSAAARSEEYPAVNLPEGQSFKLACQQCHVLPDPQRYKASEWPAVVARMEKNMGWMNIVVGNRHPPDEPQLRIEEINAFLVKYARKG